MLSKLKSYLKKSKSNSNSQRKTYLLTIHRLPHFYLGQTLKYVKGGGPMDFVYKEGRGIYWKFVFVDKNTDWVHVETDVIESRTEDRKSYNYHGFNLSPFVEVALDAAGKLHFINKGGFEPQNANTKPAQNSSSNSSSI